MYSKPDSSKASKGTVQVISSNDRLQLRFRFAGSCTFNGTDACTKIRRSHLLGLTH
ncbi:MAG: hypothetical protein KAF91_24400 [Nostoc sp. TH1S01]|nr:hypothetical protein [Nostoc sp. TH1S01]